MIYLIYITTNLTNGKKYIGSHLTSNINDNYLGSGVILKKAIKKYGKSNFQREIIAQLDNIDNMKELEEYYIQENEKEKEKQERLRKSKELE